MNIIHNKPTFEYSNTANAIYQRKYKEDPFICAIFKIKNVVYMNKRYNSEDEDIKNEYRMQRKENNKRAYLIRKNRLAEEANIKANLAS